MNLKRIAGYVAGGAIVATLIACGAGTKPSEGTRVDGGASAPVEEAKADEGAAKEDGPVIAPLGSKGLEFDAEKIDVAISKPGAYKPGAYAERPGKGIRAFVVTVTVVNRNTEAINPSISITASIGEANAEMEAIFDSDAGLKGTPSTALLPGKTVKFKYGFMGPAPEAHPVVNINVTPWELGMTTGLFQGTL